MKLRSIKIMRLFGIYDHEINLNSESGITIIYGENGVGKTTILNIINWFFEKKFYSLCTIEFSELLLEFEDSTVWKVKYNNKDDKFVSRLCLSIKEINHPSRKYELQLFIDEDNFDFKRTMSRRVAETIPNLRRLSPYRWTNILTNQILSVDDIFDEYEDRILLMSDDRNQPFFNELPDWINERIEYNGVYLLETQRLFNFGKNEDKFVTEYIKLYSEELSRDINNTINKYSLDSSELDSTFPQRLIALIKSSNKKQKSTLVYNNFQNIYEELNLLYKRRDSLIESALLNSNEGKTISDSDIQLAVEAISLYISDSNKKFDVLEELHNKIKLFKELINRRLRNKQLYIDTIKGFYVKSNLNGVEKEIPLEKLSSGEKNEIILFYRLVFHSKNISLFLIDEPEISLHISWQNMFIQDIQRIHKLNAVNVLISTHSPNIIGNYWDYTVKIS